MSQTDQKTDATPLNTYELISASKKEQIKKITSDAFADWVDKEIHYWSEIDSSIKSTDRPKFSETHGQIAADIFSHLENLQHAQKKLAPTLLFSSSDRSSIDISKYVEDAFVVDLPHHDDPLSEDFKNACLSGSVVPAIYTYRALTRHPERHFLRGYDQGITKNLDAISSAIDQKATQTISEIDNKNEQINEKIRTAEDTIKAIVAAASSAIALSEPVKFWEDRKNVHHMSANKYGRYAFISAIIFSCLLTMIVLYEYMSGTAHTVLGYEFTLPKSLSGIATILLISTAGIWSTRIFVKLMMANITLETESMERSTMIKTFVAMKAAESSIAQEAELLFYTTLFRPSNNVISEESTAPEFGKILDAILKSKSDRP